MTDRPLLAWVAKADTDRGIRFAADGESWDFWSYHRLAALARQIAGGLVDAGVGPGDVVSFVQRSGPSFVGTLFGTMLAGAVPSPIAPPMVFQDSATYRRHLSALLTAARPAVVVTEADLAEAVADIATGSGIRVVTVDALLAAGDPVAAPHRKPADLALLQFTSGSSGRARGVRVPFEALEANVAAIQQWLGMNGRRPTASWLPLHHDMGLIGCLITPIVDGSDIWLLSPEEFVHRPLRYLRCFAVHGAELTAMPSFGLQYIARRVRAEALAGLDFSGWRAIIVGAERVAEGALERFHALLAPFGLARRALLPAYGLAEATLAVTGLPLAEEWATATIEPDTMPGVPVVGCGRPLAGVTVTVADESGRPLPDGRIGEIVVRGRSVAAGYVAPSQSSSLTSLSAGVLHTGDAGLLRDGQLYVLGRLGDSMKVRARTVFAEDLEAALCAVGVPGHRVAVALGERAGIATAVAVVEHARPEWLPEVHSLLRRGAEGAQVVVLPAPNGTIPRTSSGKPKRRELWRAFLDGRLDSLQDSLPARRASSART